MFIIKMLFVYLYELHFNAFVNLNRSFVQHYIITWLCYHKKSPEQSCRSLFSSFPVKCYVSISHRLFQMASLHNNGDTFLESFLGNRVSKQQPDI